MTGKCTWFSKYSASFNNIVYWAWVCVNYFLHIKYHPKRSKTANKQSYCWNSSNYRRLSTKGEASEEPLIKNNHNFVGNQYILGNSSVVLPLHGTCVCRYMTIKQHSTTKLAAVQYAILVSGQAVVVFLFFKTLHISQQCASNIMWQILIKMWLVPLVANCSLREHSHL